MCVRESSLVTFVYVEAYFQFSDVQLCDINCFVLLF